MTNFDPGELPILLTVIYSGGLPAVGTLAGKAIYPLHHGPIPHQQQPV